jgi:hypothetical protein
MRAPETAFHHYPHAMAMCDCEPTHTWDGVDSISVRRAGEMDRCMECNTKWPAASQSSLDLSVPCAKRDATGALCVPSDGACAQCGETS